MGAVPSAAVLLVMSNVFMTFDWYAHLKDMSGRAWYVAALCIVAAVYFVFRK